MVTKKFMKDYIKLLYYIKEKLFIKL